MAEAPADPLVVDSVEAGYFRDVPILNGASLRVGPGEMVTIVGPNGAGKSTLVRVVIGLLEPWAGTVRVEGEDLTGSKPHVVIRHGVEGLHRRCRAVRLDNGELQARRAGVDAEDSLAHPS